MNYQDKTFRDMQRSCIEYCNANESAWESRKVIRQLVDELLSNDGQQEQATSHVVHNSLQGEVAAKNELINKVSNMTYKLSRKLSLYAKNAGDVKLLTDVNTNWTTLKSASDSEFLLSCSLVVTRAREYFYNLQDYEVTNEEIDAIDALITGLKKLPAIIEVKKGDNKITHQDMKSLISEARTILDKLDDAFEGFVDDASFLNGWFNARKIKGRHNSKKAETNGTEAKK